MGFVSLTEDILKRHESDVHEIMRALESDAVSITQQIHTLPQFQDIVSKLGELLADPNQPFAMNLISLRERERSLSFQVEQLQAKKSELASKNIELNERILQLTNENKRLQTQLTKFLSEYKTLQSQINGMEKATIKLKGVTSSSETRYENEIARLRNEIKSLEKIAMAAQVK